MNSYIKEVKINKPIESTSYLYDQSHGESFLALVQNCFSGNGLYILDEPEAALSPILMVFPAAEILFFSENDIVPVTYGNSEHYQVTKAFLDNPQKMLRLILENVNKADNL